MALARKLQPLGDARPDCYESDLVAWAEANAALLRQRRLAEIDVDHIAEELEDLGKSERRALGSHLRNLLLHLLKWEFQPSRRGTSWQRSIISARREIAVILEDSPSLVGSVPTLILREYPSARRLAAIETKLQAD
ncbi:DUF29 domain-containing protein, partial [uncultured Lamprocystis sp.]|uniref:DUF29 domain-containing protein n=1 Tax=uncultured Lamprocystis sp. TaxID=543132 RepID=UPI0025F5341F